MDKERQKKIQARQKAMFSDSDSDSDEKPQKKTAPDFDSMDFSQINKGAANQKEKQTELLNNSEFLKQVKNDCK